VPQVDLIARLTRELEEHRTGNPVKTVCLPLSYSGNPGVNAVSDRGFTELLRELSRQQTDSAAADREVGAPPCKIRDIFCMVRTLQG
jgi:hypothetical protein